MIPVAITREIAKLVRSRDSWRRKALDRAAVKSADRRREIAARDRAVERLLFMVWIYGIRGLGGGSKGCLWEALEALRPDITATMVNGLDDAGDALKRFFPDGEEDE